MACIFVKAVERETGRVRYREDTFSRERDGVTCSAERRGSNERVGETSLIYVGWRGF